MQDFCKLNVWQRSHELTVLVYRATVAFPKDEIYGLRSQLRRACASIPSNIAEGCGRGSNPDLARFLYIATGSASELEYYFVLAHDLNLIAASDRDRLAGEVAEIKRMLSGLMQKLKGGNRPPPADY